MSNQIQSIPLDEQYKQLFGEDSLDLWALYMAFGPEKAHKRIERAVHEQKPIDWSKEIPDWDSYQELLKDPEICF